MMIQDVPLDMCIEMLKRVNTGHLACVKDLQPYVTPISFVYNENSIYGFSTVGQKVDWMRSNPLVCLQVDEITSRQSWQSVIVFGRYGELTEDHERRAAHDLLTKFASWWEPGYVSTLVQGKRRPLDPIYFRISVDRLTGRQGLPDRR